MCAGIQYSVAKHLCERLQRAIEYVEFDVSTFLSYVYKIEISIIFPAGVLRRYTSLMGYLSCQFLLYFS